MSYIRTRACAWVDECVRGRVGVGECVRADREIEICGACAARGGDVRSRQPQRGQGSGSHGNTNRVIVYNHAKNKFAGRIMHISTSNA